MPLRRAAPVPPETPPRRERGVECQWVGDLPDRGPSDGDVGSLDGWMGRVGEDLEEDLEENAKVARIIYEYIYIK